MTDLAYILAAGHSGSTLLAMLLATHRQVCTVGEMGAAFLDDPDCHRCSCGAWIGRCTFWASVAEAMGGRGVAFDIAAAGTAFGGVGGRIAGRSPNAVATPRLALAAPGGAGCRTSSGATRCWLRCCAN